MIFIYSYGGYAREFARLIRLQEPTEELIFIDDNKHEGAVTYEDAIKIKSSFPARISIGFADWTVRRRKTEQALRDGFSLFSVIASTSILGDRVEIGDGAILSDFTMVTADARIGKSFHCNIYSYIAHDCEVGDFVTLAPRVSVNGRVIIEDNAYIGTGAIILPGTSESPIRIGKGAIIGAHALVNTNVDPGVTVVGIPAHPLRKR